MKLHLIACLSVFLIGLATAPAHSQDITAYQYDALGRLTASQTSGGPNNNIGTSISFDAAGNRTNYSVANTSLASCLIQILDRGVTLIKNGPEVSYTFYPVYSPNCSNSVVLSYSTSNGSAVAPYNYESSSGTINVVPNQVNTPLVIYEMKLGSEEYLTFNINFSIISGNATLSRSTSQIFMITD